MPFALVFIGLIMIVSGSRDTHAALGKELIADFTGEGNFLYWFAAIGVLGAVGSIPQFKNFSRVFMTLVLVAMVIRNGGFFDKLSTALKGEVVQPEKSNNNYVVGNSQTENAKGSQLNAAGGPSSNPTGALESIVNFANAGTPQARENFGKVMDVVKFFI